MSVLTDQVMPTRFQQAVLRFRGHCNILNAGGRGSGKSFSMMLDLLDHCRQHGPDARPLVLREQWAGLQELQLELLDLCTAAFGHAQRNKAEGTLTLPTGGVITFSNVADDNSYARHQGRSYTGLFADEVGNYPPQAFRFLQLVRSNLRVPSGQSIDIHWTANPHGRSHTVLFKEFVSKAPPWRPFKDEAGEPVVGATLSLSGAVFARSGISDGDGEARFGQLYPGTYDLEVSATGYITTVFEGIAIESLAHLAE